VKTYNGVEMTEDEFNKKIKEDHDKHWPAFELSLDLLAGSCEVGKDLYLLGLFGGFGGSFTSVHYDEASAIEFAKTLSMGSQVYRIKVQNMNKYVSSDGTVIDTSPTPTKDGAE
jgi:hypothetical protein